MIHIKILSRVLLRRTRFEPELNHSRTFDFECKTYSLINRWRGRQGGLIGRLDDASGMDGLEADMHDCNLLDPLMSA